MRNFLSGNTGIFSANCIAKIAIVSKRDELHNRIHVFLRRMMVEGLEDQLSVKNFKTSNKSACN